MKKSREDDLIAHGDAASILRRAKAELREHLATEARRAEVDRRTPEAPLDVPVMLIEDANGIWSMESTTTIYPSQRGPLKARDRSERIVLADFRQLLKDMLVEDRFCNEETARKKAALANVWTVARLPHHRIVSK